MARQLTTRKKWAKESRRLHREYNALVEAQRNGAKNGPEVVKLTDECAAKVDEERTQLLKLFRQEAGGVTRVADRMGLTRDAIWKKLKRLGLVHLPIEEKARARERFRLRHKDG